MSCVNNLAAIYNDLSTSATSGVFNTLTSDCSLKCGSLDQIGHPSFNASAKYCTSSGSGEIESASDMYSLNEAASSICSPSENSRSSVNPLAITAEKNMFASATSSIYT